MLSSVSMLSDSRYSQILLELGRPEALLEREDVRAFIEALDQPGKHAGRYRSWSKGRFHDPKPQGVSVEHLEALVRLHRERVSVSTSLLAYARKPMRLNLSVPTRLGIAEVVEMLAFRGASEVEAPSEEELETWQLRGLLEEAFASSAIEGAVTTRKIASELARDKRQPRGRSEQMLLNNWVALRRLGEWQEQPLTPALLCEIQSVITKDTGLKPEQVGAFRTVDDVAVINGESGEVVHQPPPAEQLAERMERLCLFAREDQGFPSLVRAILIHHQIAFDHPFVDGNGRTARLVFMLEATRDPALNWLSLVPFSRAIANQKDSYYRAFVDTAEESWDTTHFVRNQLRSLAVECERLAGFLTDFRKRRALYTQKLALEDDLNSRQIELIRSGLKPNSPPFTQVEHAHHHQVTPMTANRDLARLTGLRLLSKRRNPKDKRQFLYWPTKLMMSLGEDES
jgi:Fic family protein